MSYIEFPINVHVVVEKTIRTAMAKQYMPNTKLTKLYNKQTQKDMHKYRFL